MASSRESGFYRTFHAPKEHRTGVLVILAAAVALFVVFWLGPGGREWTDTVTATVVFDNVQGLTEGDVVLVSGVRVGRVSAVRLESVGRVTVEVELDANVRPRRDARAVVEAVGLLGSMVLSYRPGVVEEWLPDDRMIVGGRADALLGTTRIREEGTRVALLVQDLLGAGLSDDLAATRAALRRAQVAFGDLATDRLGRDAGTALAAAGRAVERIDSLRAQVAIDTADAAGLRAGAESAAVSAGEARAGLARIRARIDSGAGNLGRWQRDTVAKAHLDSVIAFLRRFSR